MQGLFRVFIFNDEVTSRFTSQLEKKLVVCFLFNVQVSDVGIKITFSLVLFVFFKRAIKCSLIILPFKMLHADFQLTG